MSLIGKVFRAAMYRPWEDDAEDDEGLDYVELVNSGAPDYREFRVSPDGGTAAVWVPESDCWLLFENVVIVRKYETSDPGSLQDWTRYLEVEDVD